MRRLPSAVFSLGLVPALLAMPTVTPPAPQPRPVAPDITTLHPTGVDAGALAQLSAGTGASLRTSEPDRAVAASPQALTGADAPTRAAAAAAPSPAVLTAPVSTGEFGLVGVTWTADEQSDPFAVSVLVRVREDGTWSDWEALSATDDGPDAGSPEMAAAAGRVGTSPLLTASADGVQVRVDTPDGTAPTGLEIDLVDPGTSPADASLGQTTALDSASASPSAPRVITRSQWGADESLAGSTVTNSTVKAVMVHHTASTNSYDTQSGAAQQMRSIYAYHTKSLGWSDVGYNFVVDKFGNIYEGRKGSIDRAVRGAHSGGFNVDTMGVSGLGNYDVTAPPAAMVDSISRVVGWKLGTYGVDPFATVSLTSAGGDTARYPKGQTVRVNTVAPHREVNLTACPGRYLNDQMDTIRKKAKSYMAPAPAPATMSAASISAATAAYADGSVSFGAQLSSAADWQVSLTPMCARTAVRTYRGTGTRVSGSWDLKTSSGTWAAPGVYRVAFTAGGQSWSSDVEVLPRTYGPTGVCSTTRISGPDRYATSVAEGRASFPTGSSVVIVSGSQANLVDGLVAGPLAYAKKAPVLMVHPGGLPAVVKDDVLRRRPSTAWIVGGTGVVPAGIVSELKALGVTNVHRLAGGDRFATAAKVALEVKAPAKLAVIASGRSLVDAVAVAGPAARTGRPVLLVDTNSVPASTAAALKTLGVLHASVIGGTGVISEATRRSLPLASAPRAAGVDRYATAAAVASAFAPVVGTSTVAVASGADANIADALAGASLGRITVLVQPDSVPAVTQAWLSTNAPGNVHVLGGVSAVSTDTLRSVHIASRS